MTAQGDATPVAKVAYEVAVDEARGTATVRVAVPAMAPQMAARALTPALALVGGGGGGPSVVGRGWALEGLAAVTVDASERLPRWDGSDGVALGGTPLVAWLDDSGAPRRRVEDGYRVAVLRPRSGFARVRVERWTSLATGAVHYRSRDEADVVTIYGARPGAAGRIADPDEPARVAAWLPEVRIDAAGNAAWYEYEAEDARGIDRRQPWEPRRPVTSQRYLRAIRYGNASPVTLTSAVLAGEAPATAWAFRLVVDYGDCGDGLPTAAPDRPWPARLDSYRSSRDGFAVATYRRVRRLVCFHERAALGPTPVPVSALELGYDDAPAGARLTSITRVGYRDGARAATAPLTFTYAAAGADDHLRPAVTAGPGLAAAGTELVDLYGEGLPGILYRGERGWLYQANQGGARFAAPTTVAAQPNLGRGVALADVDRDGDTELAVTSGRQAGSFALMREERRWNGFRPFAAWPKLEGLAGRTFWVDLNGDGRPDAVIARGDALVWFPSTSGPLDEVTAEFGTSVIVPLPQGAEAAPSCGPDARQDLYFADMDGDGLPDLVRVRAGTVEYWPSLGNGRFGARVVMDGAPRVAGYDSARVRLVDLDGTGTADLLYLDDEQVWHYPNHGGRALGPRRALMRGRYDGKTAFVADVTGDGRPSLVVTATTPGQAHAMRYLALAPATPPGALVAIDDGCGRRTELAWGNSAQHYLRDAAEGAPWSTRLPSHVTVLEARVERDQLGGTAVTTRYRYRDGYFDGAGGAFRGFGRVDALDTPSGDDGDPDVSAPPLLTRTWFHLGTPMVGHHRPFEPYAGDAALPPLGADEAPAEPTAGAAPGTPTTPWSLADLAAAWRLLAGAMVRRERWTVDARERPVGAPLDVEEVRHALVASQPRRGAQRPVFVAVVADRRVATYEGAGGDPRVMEEQVLARDRFGEPTRTATIAYARRGAVVDEAQARTWVTIADTRRTDVDTDEQFVIGAPIEAGQFELVGVAPVGGRIAPRALTAPAVVAALAAPSPFELDLDPAATAPAARRLAWQRTYYWDDARGGAAPLGAIGRVPRVHHEAVAALTPGLVAAALGGRADTALLAELGYVLADGHLWQRGAVQEVGGPFAVPVGTTRGDGATTRARWDVAWTAVEETTDPLGLTTTIAIDPTTLAPAETLDPNGLAASTAFDPFGRPTATGRVGAVVGQPWGSGPLGAWTAPAGVTLATLLADPRSFLGAAERATWRDDRAWHERGVPVAEVTVARVEHRIDGDGGGASDGPLEINVRYLDGFGRVLQDKTRVEPGPAIQRDAAGAVVVGPDGPVLAPSAERWRVSGHVVYDAKGQVRRQYEPYFSPSPAYEADLVLAQFGVATVTRHDAAGRVARVELPNGTFATTTYHAWSTVASSPGDNVASSLYRALREGRPSDDAERVAYEHALAHAATPTVTHVDGRGLPCATEDVGDASAETRWVRQRHDAAGQPVAVIDPRGLEALRITRDLRGRALAQVSIDAGATWALPDAYDRPARVWDARGVAIERRFDRADRPTTVRVIGGPDALDQVVEAVTYGDEASDRAAARAANLLGRPVLTRDGAGEVAIAAYDPSGAVRASERRLRVALDDAPNWSGAEPVEADSLPQSARTDALGRPSWTRLADGTERRERYHAGGGLAAVEVTTPDGAFTSTPIVDALTRDAHGRLAAARLGDACVVTWAYDRETGRLVAQDARRGARWYQGLRYTYDADGRITRALDLAQDGPGAIVPSAVSARRDHRYDVHGRLIEATGRTHRALSPKDPIPGSAGTIHGARPVSLNDGGALERYTQRFTYDPSGNLTSMQHVGTSASWAQTWWVSSTSNRSLDAVDANGLPVLDPETRFDAAGQPVALSHLRALDWSWRGCLTRAVTIARADGPVDDGERYTYGADRVRVRKLSTRLVVGGADPVVETREVVYLGEQERIRVRRGDTLVLERWTTHVSDGERRVATLDRHVVDTLGAEVDALGPTQVRYHLTTPQGSTAVELAADGRLITYEEYLPHGGSAFLAGDDAREVSRRDVRYAGKERDRATGLHAYPQRYYAPWLGRWLTPDPIGPAGGLNLYAFVSGDPIGYVDPEGTDRRPADPLPPIRERQVEPMPWTAPDGGGRTWTFDEQTAWYRANRSASRVRLFDSISPEEQAQHLTQGYALVDHIDPNDSSSPAGTLTPEAYEDWKLFRQAHLAGKGEHLTVAVPASQAESVTVKNGLGEFDVSIAGNQSFESQYQAVHEYTTRGPLTIDTITSGLGGMGLGRSEGHAQFRVIDLSVGGRTARDYQVFAGLFTYSGTSYRWQSIPFETFEHFRNVNNAYEQDPFGWSEVTGYDNPTGYFTDALSQQAIAREGFHALMRSLQREIAKFAIRMIPGVGEYEAGVGVGEALMRRESGMTIDAAVDGNFGQLGPKLNGWEIGFRVFGATLTAAGLSTQYAAQLRSQREAVKAAVRPFETISDADLEFVRGGSSFNRHVQKLRTEGGDVFVGSVEEARALLREFPELRPAGQGGLMPNPSRRLGDGFADQRGTFRGDLINVRDPAGPIHPGVDNLDHANWPHYNITFLNGRKGAIIIKP
ncbi:MAG: VCBS repeat-containing protein [Kofleriaceae bacterium]|nr:VCBS repeat-containing protein [Kofleriaceae bacterium]MBP9857221.1 VCBS repeat-containing protein [Kofleriaceae bacterium]